MSAGLAEAQEPATPSPAQVALPLNRFEPSWAGDRFFSTSAPYVPGHFQVNARLDGEYVHDPFVLRERGADDEAEEVGSVVRHQVLMHANATLTVYSRLALNVDVPVALHQSGDDVGTGSDAFIAPSGADIGDLRIGMRASLTGTRNDFFQLGIGGLFWVPTASSEPGSYLGNGHIRGKPHIMASGVALRFVWGLDAGIEFRETQEVLGVKQGTMLTLKLANGVLLGPKDEVQLSMELMGALTPVDVGNRTNNFELLAGAKWRFWRGFVVGGGVGPGLFTGIGTPDARALLSLAYEPGGGPRRKPKR